jgi:hypothetical protein
MPTADDLSGTGSNGEGRAASRAAASTEASVAGSTARHPARGRHIRGWVQILLSATGPLLPSKGSPTSWRSCR